MYKFEEIHGIIPNLKALIVVFQIFYFILVLLTTTKMIVKNK